MISVIRRVRKLACERVVDGLHREVSDYVRAGYTLADIQELVSQEAVIAAVLDTEGYRQRIAAEHLGCHYNTVGNYLRRWLERAEKETRGRS